MLRGGELVRKKRIDEDSAVRRLLLNFVISGGVRLWGRSLRMMDWRKKDGEKKNPLWKFYHENKKGNAVVVWKRLRIKMKIFVFCFILLIGLFSGGWGVKDGISEGIWHQRKGATREGELECAGRDDDALEGRRKSNYYSRSGDGTTSSPLRPEEV